MAFHSIATITFNQPLWWKAMTIIERQAQGSHLHSIVLRLCGVHRLLSLLGASEDTVAQMLAGNACDKALEGQLLVAAAFNYIIAAKVFSLPIIQVEDAQDDDIDDGHN